MTPKQMDEITKGLQSKSDKIRALGAAGAKPADIARYLGIRYQFAYNVLTGRYSKRAEGENSSDADAEKVDAGDAPLTIEAAKRGLAAHFGVPTDAIEITIRG